MTWEFIVAALSGPAAMAAWSGTGKVLGHIAKRRADAAAKRTEAEAMALTIRAHGAVTEAQTHDAILSRVVEQHADRMVAMERRLDRCEQRHDDCERRNDDCERHLSDVRAENGMLVKEVDHLRERMDGIEARVSERPPSSLVEAVKREVETK